MLTSPFLKTKPPVLPWTFFEVLGILVEVIAKMSMWAGALSAGAAIGCTIMILRRMGGFSLASTVPEEKYIDPSCPPTQAAIFFFGWMRPTPTT